MTTLIHADIFFFVTTIVVVLVGVALVVALVYLIMILHRVRDIAEEVREETVLFREDVHDLRDSIRREGFNVRNLFHSFQFFKNLFNRRKTNRIKKSKE